MADDIFSIREIEACGKKHAHGKIFSVWPKQIESEVAKKGPGDCSPGPQNAYDVG